MIEVELVEKIEKPISFKNLKVGDVFTWGAKNEAYIKIDSQKAFCISQPISGCMTVDCTLNLTMCEAKLLVAGLAARCKPNPSSVC